MASAAQNPDLISLAYPAINGVNNSEDPVLFYPKASGTFIQQATNMRIFRDRWRTRYQVKATPPAGDPAVIAQWQADHSQNAIWYLPSSGQGTHYIGKGVPRIIESAAGRMYCLTPRGNSILVEDISGGVQAYPPLRLAWLTQAENYVFRTDGSSMTQIWDGEGTVFGSPGYNSNVKERSRFPNAAGPTVYAGGYMWACLFGRRLYVSDSLHETDQIGASDLLNFTDQSYDTTNVYFAPPTSEGDITALAVSASSGYDNSRAQGEVLSMCHGPAVWAVTLGIPRTDSNGQGSWATADMRHTRSLECAATGPNAFFIRDGDILMRTSRGIESMNMLARERSQAVGSSIGNSTVDIGANMFRVLQADDEPSLLFCSLINPIRWSRMLCTAAPIIRGPRHWHMGWTALNWNPTSASQPQAIAWEGVQTLPRSMGRIIQFLPAVINGQTVVSALVDKGDGNSKGIVQFGQTEGHDIDEQGNRIPIEWSLTTHPLTTGGTFKPSTFGSMYLSLWQMRTDVTVTIYIRDERNRTYRPWKKATVRAIADPSSPFGCPEGASKRLTLGKPTINSKDVTWVQFKIVGTGVTSVDVALRPDVANEPSDTPDPECVDALGDPPCQEDPFSYARTGPDAPARQPGPVPLPT